MTAVGLITPHVDPARLAIAHRTIASLREFPLDLLDPALR
jgi:hypothetical protein